MQSKGKYYPKGILTNLHENTILEQKNIQKEYLMGIDKIWEDRRKNILEFTNDNNNKQYFFKFWEENKKYFNRFEDKPEYWIIELFPKDWFIEMELELNSKFRDTANAHFFYLSQNDNHKTNLENEWKKYTIESIIKLTYNEWWRQMKKERVNAIWLLLAILFLIWNIIWITENWKKNDLISKIESAQNYNEVNSIMNEYIREEEYQSIR